MAIPASLRQPIPTRQRSVISAGGTAWAVIALLNKIELTTKREALRPRDVDDKIFQAGQRSSESGGRDWGGNQHRCACRSRIHSRHSAVFQKSCVGCHSGKKQKGDFNLESVAGLLEGGQSGEASIVPGQPERRHLLTYVSDQLENFEMPPLSKRAKCPALTKDVVAKLSRWIAQGELATGHAFNAATWTATAAGSSASSLCLRHAGEQFVAVGSRSAILSSTDARQWIRQDSKLTTASMA